MGVPKHAFFRLRNKWTKSLPSRRPGPVNTLLSTEQVLVFFLHLRHYLPFLLIGMIFNTTRKVISSTVNNTLTFFDNYLSPQISLGTLESRMRECVHFFQTPITFLMDGTEQKIHSSANIFHENNFFSSKKKQHSITLLLIISPKGRIIYLSLCYFGSIVDKELLHRTMHEWAPQLRLEWGMADSGFDGQRARRELNILTPLHSHDHPMYKLFSTIRIRVENVIAKLKVFECLHQEVREPIIGNSDLLQKHTTRWRIVASLHNHKIDNYNKL